jgi:5-methylcytosine-specific restriction endonuclease McrA
MVVYVRNRDGHPLMPFANRGASKRSGRLPPSIRTNVEEIIRVVMQIPLPISSLVIEDVQVDVARLNNPELKGSEYQEPTRLDENLRIACLMCAHYTCQQCGKQGIRLDAHHLIFREHGGKDTLSNLLTLCEHCHHRLHEEKITLKVIGVSGHLDQVAQRSMQGDIVLVKKTWVKQVNATPQDCRLLEREQTIIWKEYHETL